MQSNPNDTSVLATAERGIFIVELKSEQPEYKEKFEWLVTVIKQAELAGYLRTGKTKTTGLNNFYSSDSIAKKVSFRLHNRLAPYFRFSHRGAYEPVSLSFEALSGLIDVESPVEPKAWAESVLKSGTFSQDIEQLKLEFNFDETD